MLGVSRALGWTLGEVDARSHALATDSTTADTLASQLRSDADATLQWMAGNTVDSARSEIDDLVSRAHQLSDHLDLAARTLATFSTNASAQQSRLRSAVDSVVRAGGSVAEDGTVTMPAASGSAAPEPDPGLEFEIKAALRALDHIDTDAAASLTGLHDSVPDYGNNYDPATSIAGGVISAQTGVLAGLLELSDDGLRSTRVVAKGLGPFGNALGFIAGVYGAPADEPMSETLAAEGAGLLAGVVGGAASAAVAGALVGSGVPIVGTVVGAITGAVVGGIAGHLTAAKMRDEFDDNRRAGG